MGRWTSFDVLTEASKYETRKWFRLGSPYAYTLALKLGMIDDLFPRTNTLPAAIRLAVKTNDATWFRKLYPAAARMLHRNGYTNLGVKKSNTGYEDRQALKRMMLEYVEKMKNSC